MCFLVSCLSGRLTASVHFLQPEISTRSEKLIKGARGLFYHIHGKSIHSGIHQLYVNISFQKPAPTWLTGLISWTDGSTSEFMVWFYCRSSVFAITKLKRNLRHDEKSKDKRQRVLKQNKEDRKMPRPRVWSGLDLFKKEKFREVNYCCKVHRYALYLFLRQKLFFCTSFLWKRFCSCLGFWWCILGTIYIWCFDLLRQHASVTLLGKHNDSLHHRFRASYVASALYKTQHTKKMTWLVECW